MRPARRLITSTGPNDLVHGWQRAVEPDTGVDVLIGIGGTPEGFLAACALKCLGGAFFGRLYSRDDTERRLAREAG
jgi:fructose-1,6-bisphosphatase II